MTEPPNFYKSRTANAHICTLGPWSFYIKRLLCGVSIAVGGYTRIALRCVPVTIFQAALS